MQTLTLGKTGLTVSELCLGTMTWGTPEHRRPRAMPRPTWRWSMA